MANSGGWLPEGEERHPHRASAAQLHRGEFWARKRSVSRLRVPWRCGGWVSEWCRALRTRQFVEARYVCRSYHGASLQLWMSNPVEDARIRLTVEIYSAALRMITWMAQNPEKLDSGV
jgi:hypothetical protein